jgi:hypothetical protein
MNQPVQLAGRRRAGVLASMQHGLSQVAPPRISLKAMAFTLVDSMGVQIPMQLFDQQFGRYIDVVIIGANPSKSKVYYEFEYDPTKDEPPTCFSDNGIGASSQASSPQNAEGGFLCATCPNNVWGSSTSRMTNKPTKACNDRKKLAVLVCNDPAQLVYQLNIPPASLKNLSALATALRGHQITDSEGQRAADPGDVVTRIYFNPQKQGELLFQPIGFHQQMYPYVDGLIEKVDASGAIETAIGTDDRPVSAALPAPAPVQQLAAPQPMPQMQAPPPAAPQYAPMPFDPNSQGHTVPAQPVYAPQPAAGQAFGSPQPAQQFSPPAAGQANGGTPPAPPAPRTRRGGVRAGAGRPVQQPDPAPTQAPFQQQAPVQQMPPQFAPQPQQGGPVSFQPHAAPPVSGPIPTQAMPAGSPQMPEMPGFLRQPQPQPQGQPAFGMQQGAQPDPALSAALDNAFGAPLQPRQR